jgi:hypothetical protein
MIADGNVKAFCWQQNIIQTTRQKIKYYAALIFKMGKCVPLEEARHVGAKLTAESWTQASDEAIRRLNL